MKNLTPQLDLLIQATQKRESLGIKYLQKHDVRGLTFVPVGSQSIIAKRSPHSTCADSFEQPEIIVTRALHTLIIDDNKDLARLYANLLEVMGCTATVACTGEYGLANAQERIPNIIFCDVNMPGNKNGLDVAREIRADKDFDDTLLVAITGFNDADSVEEARTAGFDRVFGKPIKFAQLAEIVNNYCTK